MSLMDVSGDTSIRRRAAVVAALAEAGPLPWHVLRDGYDATSADMNKLTSLDFITTNGTTWMLTPTGRGAYQWAKQAREARDES